MVVFLNAGGDQKLCYYGLVENICKHKSLGVRNGIIINVRGPNSHTNHDGEYVLYDHLALYQAPQPCCKQAKNEVQE